MSTETDMTPGERRRTHRRAIWLEVFTVAWNVIEAAVAVGAGVIAASTALVAFGLDSLIEVTSAAALLWRLLKAGPDATVAEQGRAERRALFVVAGTFFLLAGYVVIESVRSLTGGGEADPSTVGLILSAVSLLVMPVLAIAKWRTASKLGSRALRADAIETWVCVYLSFTLLAGVGLNTAFGWWWADAVGALAMLPVILWQGWETFEDARGE